MMVQFVIALYEFIQIKICTIKIIILDINAV